MKRYQNINDSKDIINNETDKEVKQLAQDELKDSLRKNITTKDLTRY